MVWMEISVDDWDQLVGFFEKLRYGRPSAPARYYTRSMANAQWFLEDSLTHFEARKTRVSPDAVNLEELLFQTSRRTSSSPLHGSLLHAGSPIAAGMVVTDATLSPRNKTLGLDCLPLCRIILCCGGELGRGGRSLEL